MSHTRKNTTRDVVLAVMVSIASILVARFVGAGDVVVTAATTSGARAEQRVSAAPGEVTRITLALAD